MPNPIRLCLVLHNHQPVGNFPEVFEQAYEDSYLPFIDVFDSYSDLRISLHTSGPLMEWLDEHHPDYVDRLAGYVATGRMEIVGGAYYEPILTMIPRRDRVGQITRYTRWLQNRLGADVRGMWVPERVWEQSLASDLADAEIQYTLLDDFHFKNSGARSDDLHGYYVTEDDGKLLFVFPGSEQLRYFIPFAEPHQTIDYLRSIAETRENAVVVFGDDGEKFGTWPDTKRHVYDNGWLRRFFDALAENQEWLKTTTLADAVDNTPPVGKIYLSDSSYREMTEWSLPTERQLEFERLQHDLEHDERWPQIREYVRGGFWRNFKVKYPEADEMYARMMMVSRRLAEVERVGADLELLDSACRELYRGQCNCSYWHGAFGGIYLPHLRNAVYNHLIAADNLLDEALGKPANWVEATAADYNLDTRQEVQLVNDRVGCLFAPHAGGQLYELDVRSICHNLLSTLTRRPEAYHQKVRGGATESNGDVASIHDRVIFKQEGLDERLHYDNHARKSLLDHFYPSDVSLDSVARGEMSELGNFVDLPFAARIRRNPDRIQVMMSADGQVDGAAVRIVKGVTLKAGSNTLEIAYMLEGLPADRPLHFGVEFNFAGLPAGADDRFFYGEGGSRLGDLGQQLDLSDAEFLGMTDEWLGIDVRWSSDRPTNVWTFPIATVSQSEGGFELVHQSLVVHPHWHIVANAEGRWSVKMQLALDTKLAESRMAPQAEVLAT
jgi:alpha-amylase